jgi:hypothetical protein
MSIVPAQPEYAIGDTVAYKDHHGRDQIGKVTWIEATWGWSGNASPAITYTVSHPTYRNGRMYVGTSSIKETTNEG